mgnify:FL=1
MALSISQTRALEKELKPGMRVASFGYPDLIAPVEAFEKMLGVEAQNLKYREDSDAICKRHGLEKRPIPDAESFFRLMGAKLDVYDIVAERGCEIICDLNQPMKARMSHDIVLDVGTVEHCFNIAQAMMNMSMMVRLGGVIIHENPFNWGNHGFYNLNPTWYHDFYKANGFELMALHLVARDGSVGLPHPTQRFRYQGGECNIFAVAKRVEVGNMVYPVQSKYAKLIPAASDSGERAADARAIGA